MTNFEIVSSIFLAIVVILLTVIAVRVDFKFDVNKWLESRKEVRKTKLKNMCPHACASFKDDQIIIESLLVSPSGTPNWHCQQCLRVFYQVSASNMEYWGKNPRELIDKQKAYRKQVKKMGLAP